MAARISFAGYRDAMAEVRIYDEVHLDPDLPAPVKLQGVFIRALSRRAGVILVECHAIHIAVTDFRKRSSPNACGCTLTSP
jgi:hypothetical protein